MQRLWLGAPIIVVGLLASAPVTADSTVLRPIFWIYDFDGTDAKLGGIAERQGNGEKVLSFWFDCSKAWIRISIRGAEFSNEEALGDVSGQAAIHIGDTAIKTSWRGGSIVEVTTIYDEINRHFVKQFFDITSSFYHDETDRIAIHISDIGKGIRNSFQYNLRSSDSEFFQRGKRNIAQFRERCSGWWDGYLY